MSVVPFLLSTSPAQILEGTGHELDALLSVSARARLLRGCAVLPLPARTVCLECRLDDDERVDLALCLATHTAGLVTALEALGRGYADDRQWQRCVRLLVAWAHGQETPLAAVPFLFTAFDLATEVSAMPVPCLSLCTDPSFFLRRLGLPAPRTPHEVSLRLLDACSSSLELDWVTAALRKRAEQCLEAAADVELRQLSLMLARQPATLKLDLTLPTAELLRFLAALGWRGNAAEVAEQLYVLAPWQRRVQLNYVVNSLTEQPLLEVELCCTGADEPTEAERAALLERLVGRGVVKAAKAKALLDLLRRPATIDANGQWVARNWYLKLRFDGGRLDSAKAYIGLMQRSSNKSLQSPAELPNSH